MRLECFARSPPKADDVAIPLITGGDYFAEPVLNVLRFFVALRMTESEGLAKQPYVIKRPQLRYCLTLTPLKLYITHIY